MSEELKEFKTIIRICDYENTYKMAWAKALVELSMEINPNHEVISISLKDIAIKYFKYYFNCTIFFDLIQGSNILKCPKIVTDIKTFIEQYFKASKSKKPIFFEKLESLLDYYDLKKEYEKTIISIVKTLKADVSYRFLNISGNISSIYKYEKKSNELYISKDLLNDLKNECWDLFDIINFRWALILENYNSSPRINKKIRILNDMQVKRTPLVKFSKFLDLENPKHVCFNCGLKIEDKDLSIDHVIPWSYLYSDDLWNLVYVHKSCNSIKSNSIVEEFHINKLKDRNNCLYQIAQNLNFENKDIKELKLANDNNYVYKFWIGCRR